MADLPISNQLAAQLYELAQQENRPLEAVLVAMLEQYTGQHLEQEQKSADAPETNPAYPDAVGDLRRKLYAMARRYWTEVGDRDRLALTDDQLDEQFWLIDSEGIPRLKSEQDAVTISASSLYNLGQAAQRVAFKSGQPDIVERSRDILHNEYGNYMRRHLDRPADDPQ